LLNELQKSNPDLPNNIIWGISDAANGLMALPNLIGLIFLGGLVAKITKNYFDRKKGKAVEPMLSAYPEQNEQFKADIAEQEKAEKGEAGGEEQPSLEEETPIQEEDVQ